MAFKKISIRDVATLFINKVHLVKFLPILKSILKKQNLSFASCANKPQKLKKGYKLNFSSCNIS